MLPGELPAAYVQRVTALKLRAAVARHARAGLAPGAILCADTTVALGRRILGKPADAADAAATLAALSGRTPPRADGGGAAGRAPALAGAAGLARALCACCRRR